MKYETAHKLTKQRISLAKFKKKLANMGRQGQTKVLTTHRTIDGVKIPPGWYVKGGHMFRYDIVKDFNRQALIKRNPKDLGYFRGDAVPQGEKLAQIKSGRI